MTDTTESWNFTVVGCDSHNTPKYLGFTQTRQDALTLKKNMESLGWQRIAIFDAALQEQIETLQKELAEKDKQIEHREELLRRQQGQGYRRG